MTILIRPATEPDLPRLLALYGELHPEDGPLPADRAGRIWRDIAAQAGRTVLLATLAGTTLDGVAAAQDGPPAEPGETLTGPDGSIVGTLDCTVLPNLTRGGRPFMLLENVIVAAAARRHGVGRRLIDEALARARAENCYKVQLLTRQDRVGAHAFYASCGFRATARGFRAYLD